MHSKEKRFRLSLWATTSSVLISIGGLAVGAVEGNYMGPLALAACVCVITMQMFYAQGLHEWEDAFQGEMEKAHRDIHLALVSLKDEIVPKINGTDSIQMINTRKELYVLMETRVVQLCLEPVMNLG